MSFTLSLTEHSESGSPYPHWLMVKGSDHLEDDEIIEVLTETFGSGGGKFPDLEARWGHKSHFGNMVLMFRTLEDRILARLRITC